MTNHEIIGQAFYPHECGGMIECVTKQDALKSMNEARKDEAVAFAEWIAINCYDHSAADVFYSWKIQPNEWLISQDGMCKKTTPELYSIFKQQNEKL